MNPFAAILSIIADSLSIFKKRDELKNAPDVKEAKKRQDELSKIDYITDKVAHQDINEVRKILSE